MMKIHYNAPVVLTFSLAATIIFCVDYWVFGHRLTANLLVLPGIWDWNNLANYLRIMLYPLGHQSPDHLLSNLSFFLIIAPIMEEKYGPVNIAKMMIATTLITAFFQILLFDTQLLGASGLVFMFIILISFADVRKGSIPLTFIFVMIFFVGKEVWDSISARDQVSQYAHIAGGICGAIFGFTMQDKPKA